MIIIMLLSISGFLITQSQQSSVSAEEAVITVDDLNIRKGPGMEYEILGQANQNASVQILDQSGNWAKIQFQNTEGWVSRDYIRKRSDQNQSKKVVQISVTDANVGVHSNPSLSSEIIQKVSTEQSFPIVDEEKGWYQIQLSNGDQGWIGKWLVDSNLDTDKPVIGKANTLEGKVIVIDAGHGGADTGTISASGNYEKYITTITAQSLEKKLKTLGARPVMTRTDDTFLTLENRVAHAQAYQADAFISIHYNSAPQFPNVNGIGTYYYHDRQKSLASSIHQKVLEATGAKDRKVTFGNFLVIRENQQPATLIELGFLSNAQEEAKINTMTFQEKATNGIIRGLIDYFQ
ncbi:N-acetylmuramoyl-L-alanine amidase [Salinibacillus kushneri]|uniref:N-acetylmuramoyl-L-alanine amidase n=1 Tax=Salinibacillus kushneri TaxID=237682 RepID=UPI000B86A9AF|nr:N-acetylmuramoyl-L-alanine amidase [Salinibacillus kushneri]